MGIDANTAAPRRVVKSDSSGRWFKIPHRIFGVNATLDRVEPRGRMRDVRGKRLTRSDANLLLDQVATVNLFRDGVLHLNASIHLDEVKVPNGIDEKFDRPGIFITD